jgi:hypothetical protein
MPLPKLKAGNPNTPMRRGKKVKSSRSMTAKKSRPNVRAKKAVKAAYGSYAG